jgi:Domain of unknown function (DUF5122) beta-propeller
MKRRGDLRDLDVPGLGFITSRSSGCRGPSMLSSTSAPCNKSGPSRPPAQHLVGLRGRPGGGAQGGAHDDRSPDDGSPRQGSADTYRRGSVRRVGLVGGRDLGGPGRRRRHVHGNAWRRRHPPHPGARRLERDPDGSLDPTFDHDGIVVTAVSQDDDAIGAVAMQPSGWIVTGGSAVIGASYDFALGPYEKDGSLDVSFGDDGVTTTDFFGLDDTAPGLALVPGGKVILGGSAASPATRSDFRPSGLHQGRIPRPDLRWQRNDDRLLWIERLLLRTRRSARWTNGRCWPSLRGGP